MTERSSDHDALRAFLTARGYVAVPLSCNAVGHFEVADARLDGVPVRLLLDTGASHTVLDRESVARRGLATAASERRGGGVGGADQALATATVDRLSLGPAVFAGVSAYAMDLGHVSAALAERGGAPIDGAVGGDLLRPAEAVIDYARSTLYLKVPAQRTPHGAATG
jgi:predicted aspartyl protease